MSCFLLADVFQNFKNQIINSFELDPTHYLFTSGYSCDAMLRFTGVSFKIISDVENYQLIECMIRGSIE